jgi:hypothetical protein
MTIFNWYLNGITCRKFEEFVIMCCTLEKNKHENSLNQLSGLSEVWSNSVRINEVLLYFHKMLIVFEIISVYHSVCGKTVVLLLSCLWPLGYLL